MRKTTIYRFHTQDKTYVFADRRTPEKIIESYSHNYEKRKAVNNFHGIRYELFEHQTPDLTAIEEYEGTNDEIRSCVKHYREHFNCITLNPDIIAKHDRLALEWKEENRKRAKQYYHDNKEKVQQYRQENKEQINAREKKYYQKNKEKINARKREKITCECGAIVSKRYMPRHKNTNKHKNNMPEAIIENELIEIMPKELLGIVEEYTRPLNFDTAPELSSIIKETTDVKIGDLIIVQYFPEKVSVQKIIDITKESWTICFCDVDIEDPPPGHPVKKGYVSLYRLDTIRPSTRTYERKKTRGVMKIITKTDAFIFIHDHHPLF